MQPLLKKCMYVLLTDDNLLIYKVLVSFLDVRLQLAYSCVSHGFASGTWKGVLYSWCFETWYSHLPDNQNVMGKNGCYRRIPIQCLLTCGSRKWVVSRAPCDNRVLEPQIHLVVPSSWERREMAAGNGAFWKGDRTSLPTSSPTACLYWCCCAS